VIARSTGNARPGIGKPGRFPRGRTGRLRPATIRGARRDRRVAKLGAVLLGCGVVSSFLYAATDVLAGVRYDGYSFKSQAVSELSAAGVPTRPLVVALSTPYNALVIALGVGVWMVPGRRRAGRLAAALLIGSAVVGEVTTLFFPMDQRGAEETLRGSLHPPLTAVMSLFIAAAMISAAALQGRRFRVYSIGTILTLVVFGALAARYAPQLEAGEPTPWLGVLERINIYALPAVGSGAGHLPVAAPGPVARSVSSMPRMPPDVETSASHDWPLAVVAFK
jgi:Protein of unknown function (DUF998)